MSRLATSFVLGYHGCDQAVADDLVVGGAHITDSAKDIDWLGPGAYFWESDPLRALEWAHWKKDRGEYNNPTVVGAIIDLRNCLDLISRDDLELVRFAHLSFVEMQTKAKLEIPRNLSPRRQPDEDRVLRYLDCAVIRHLHEMLRDEDVREALQREPFDTVRGMFTEGGPLYEGAGFAAKSHVQIAVRNPSCILGFFWPRPYPQLNASVFPGGTEAS
ncbi:hypothetical protein V5F59_14370 [Xanthobacter autotrophicus DSM 431]|uniref:hypothetical protein n=1 Tax=Xanthobacter nonsaccharivorans TaxID=3119912 RepID=UPI0037285673